MLCSLVNPSSPKSKLYYQRVLKRREAREQLCGICLATRPGGDRQKRHLLAWEWWFDRRCFDPQGRAFSFQSSVPRSVCRRHIPPLRPRRRGAWTVLCCAVQRTVRVLDSTVCPHNRIYSRSRSISSSLLRITFTPSFVRLSYHQLVGSIKVWRLTDSALATKIFAEQRTDHHRPRPARTTAASAGT